MLYTFKEWFLRREAVTGLEDETLTLYHGCTTSSAHNIMSKGLQNRSEFEVTNMAGEFWATTNYAYASLMSFMPGYTQATAEDPPVVLQFKLPARAIQRMKQGKHYNSHGVGAFEFRSTAYSFLNKQIQNTWKVMPLEASAEQKWQQELNKKAA